MDCAKLLLNFHSKVGESKLKVVHKKYSNLKRGFVALFLPVKSLLSGGASTDIVKTEMLSSMSRPAKSKLSDSSQGAQKVHKQGQAAGTF